MSGQGRERGFGPGVADSAAPRSAAAAAPALPGASPAAAHDAGLSARARVLGMLAITLIYAVCFAAIKAGLNLAPPLRFAGLRTLIGGVALLGVALARREPWRPARRHAPALALLALSANTLAYGAMFLSPGRTGAGIASVLGNAQPLVTVALAALWLGERLTRGKALALALGLGGVTLIAAPALAGPSAYGVSGALLALTVSVGSAFGSVLIKRLGPLPSLLAFSAWGLILGSLPLLGASWLTERGRPLTWNAAFIGLLLFLALIGTSLATALWYWLVQREDVGRLTLYLFLVPVIGLGIATLAFDEPIGLTTALGVALALGGIGVATSTPAAVLTWIAARRGARTAGLPRP